MIHFILTKMLGCIEKVLTYVCVYMCIYLIYLIYVSILGNTRIRTRNHFCFIFYTCIEHPQDHPSCSMIH